MLKASERCNENIFGSVKRCTRCALLQVNSRFARVLVLHSNATRVHSENGENAGKKQPFPNLWRLKNIFPSKVLIYSRGERIISYEKGKKRTIFEEPHRRNSEMYIKRNETMSGRHFI